MNIKHLSIISFIFFLIFQEKITAQIGINATNTVPATNAMLDISSTTKGLLIPRMTTVQRNALTVSDGLTVYDTNTQSYWYVKGTVWAEMVGTGGGGSGPWAIAGNNISNTNTENVGIGTTNPLAKLHVAGTSIINNDLNVGGTGFFGGTNSYSGTRVSAGGINIPVTFDGVGKSILFDWGYNNIKAGIGYKPTAGVYGSDMFFHIWDNTSSFIFGRDDPIGYGGAYFAEWMRLKNGNLGLGTANPDSKLHVVGNTHLAGSLRIEDGNQGLNKVLTSNALGEGTWQTLPVPAASGWTASGFNTYNTGLTAGFVGIGTTTPGFPLNFNNTLGDKISLYGNTGFHYGFGIQSGLLQIHTDAAAANIAFGYGQSSSFTERARIINSGEYGMSLTGRLQLRTGSQSAGLWLSNTANNANSSFIGLAADDKVGFYGTGPTQWGLVMDTNNGNVGIGTTNPLSPLSFNNPFGKIAISLFKGGLGDVGLGVWANELRLQCDSPTGKVSFGDLDANGIYFELARAANENQKFTVNGHVGASGYVTFSDERYKKEIKTIPNALNNLLQLRGTNYQFRTKEFAKNNFTEGTQFGLIAQEVEKIFPELVANNNDGYKTVNYQGLIPVLIESIKDLKKEIDKKNESIDILINTLTAKSNEIDEIKVAIKALKLSNN